MIGLRIFVVWVCGLFLQSISASSEEREIANSPAENPPSLIPVYEKPQVGEEPRFRVLSEPTTEWTLHKTEDGAHPDGNEQQMVWLMNRARTDPAQEGLYLSDTGNRRVDSAVSYFGVDIELMKAELAAFAPKPPAAFDRRIYLGSKVHSEDLIARDEQDHNNQFSRIGDAGFRLSGGNASVFSFADDPIHAHAAFNIDWGGDDGTGMQSGRGHRQGIMAGKLNSTNVGIAMVPETDSKTQVGELVTSIVYARASRSAANHYNRFLVGTVWEDDNENGIYDPGEGLSGVRVSPSIGDFYAVTGASGGWAIPALQEGQYLITFDGGDLSETEQRSASVGSESVLVVWNQADTFVDLESAASSPAILSIEKFDGSTEVSWKEGPGQSIQLQVWKGTGWEDDNRTIESDGDRRTATFADSEMTGSFLVRIVAGVPESQ